MSLPSKPPRYLAAATLLLAGCSTAEVDIGTAVAEELAQRADGVAAALADGDGCLALDRIDGLRSATAAAREADDVPDGVAAEVLTTAQRIERNIRCEPEPASEQDSEQDPEQDRDAADDDDDAAGAGHDEGDEADEQPGNRGRGHGRDDAPGRSDD